MWPTAESCMKNIVEYSFFQIFFLEHECIFYESVMNHVRIFEKIVRICIILENRMDLVCFFVWNMCMKHSIIIISLYGSMFLCMKHQKNLYGTKEKNILKHDTLWNFCEFAYFFISSHVHCRFSWFSVFIYSVWFLVCKSVLFCTLQIWNACSIYLVWIFCKCMN